MRRNPDDPVIRHHEPRRAQPTYYRPPLDDFLLPRLQRRQFEGGVGFHDPRWDDWEETMMKRGRK